VIVGGGGDKLNLRFAENTFEPIGPRKETFLNLVKLAFYMRRIL